MSSEKFDADFCPGFLDISLRFLDGDLVGVDDRVPRARASPRHRRHRRPQDVPGREKNEQRQGMRGIGGVAEDPEAGGAMMT